MVEQESTLSRSTVLSLDTVNPPSIKIDAKGRSVYGDLRLNCQELVYDGKALSFVSAEIVIEAFQGAVLLSKLDYIPLSWLEAAEEKGPLSSPEERSSGICEVSI